MSERIELLRRGFVTHDVQQFICSKPAGFAFEPGQGVELAIDDEGWRDEGRPFTPTSAPEDGVLEFVIKRYPEHHGVTARLHGLAPGSGLLLSEPFGTIQDRGPGVFVAGGAGITPFLSILRRRAARGALDGCVLLFSNKTAADVICERELRAYLGERCHLFLTRESAPGARHRRIDRESLSEIVEDVSRRFYVCGPDAFVADLKASLVDLGASPQTVVVEE